MGKYAVSPEVDKATLGALFGGRRDEAAEIFHGRHPDPMSTIMCEEGRRFGSRKRRASRAARERAAEQHKYKGE